MYKRSVNDSSCAFDNTDGFPNKRQQQQYPHQQSDMSSGSTTLKTANTSKPLNVRILGREYPLTSTAYKRLIIGIV